MCGHYSWPKFSSLWFFLLGGSSSPFITNGQNKTVQTHVVTSNTNIKDLTSNAYQHCVTWHNRMANITVLIVPVKVALYPICTKIKVVFKMTAIFLIICCHVTGILHSDWLSSVLVNCVLEECQLGLREGCPHSTHQNRQGRHDKSHSALAVTQLKT